MRKKRANSDRDIYRILARIPTRSDLYVSVAFVVKRLCRMYYVVSHTNTHRSGIAVVAIWATKARERKEKERAEGKGRLGRSLLVPVQVRAIRPLSSSVQTEHTRSQGFSPIY